MGSCTAAHCQSVPSTCRLKGGNGLLAGAFVRCHQRRADKTRLIGGQADDPRLRAWVCGHWGVGLGQQHLGRGNKHAQFATRWSTWAIQLFLGGIGPTLLDHAILRLAQFKQRAVGIQLGHKCCTRQSLEMNVPRALWGTSRQLRAKEIMPPLVTSHVDRVVPPRVDGMHDTRVTAHKGALEAVEEQKYLLLPTSWQAS